MGALSQVKSFKNRNEAEVYAAISSELYGQEYIVKSYCNGKPRPRFTPKPRPCGVMRNVA